VVRVEHTDGGADRAVVITRDSDAERNIRGAGEDVRAGQVILTRGRELTPAAIGVLAMTGHRDVSVGRRPRIGVLANGDEIVDFDRVDEVLKGRRIMNSNSYALAAQLADCGADAVLLGVAGDDPDSVRERVESAAGCDALISTAGVSVGDHDHVRAALGELGAEPVFWRARIRPGGPIALNMLEDRPVWSLPGNPVSAMVTFEIFLRPAIRKMAGHARLLPRLLRCRTGKAMRSVVELTHFLRVTIDPATGDLPRVALTGPQGSGILTSMSQADGLAIVPEGVGELAAGSPVDVVPLRR
jgi:molybdopterin molybdotransferase